MQSELRRHVLRIRVLRWLRWPGACNYDETATLLDADACDYSCVGCKDELALNYCAIAPSTTQSCVLTVKASFTSLL